MKSLSWALAISVGLSVQENRAQAASSLCDYLLSTYIQAHRGDQDFREVRTFLDDADDLLAETTIPLSDLAPYAPLFKLNGLAYSALREELRASLAISGEKNIKDTLDIFRKMQDYKSLKGLADRTVSRILSQIVNDRPFRDPADFENFHRQGEKLELTWSQYRALVDAKSNDKGLEHVTLRTTLFYLLLEAKPSLIKKVADSTLLKHRFRKSKAVGTESLIRQEMPYPGQKEIVDVQLNYLEVLAKSNDPKFQTLFNSYLDNIFSVGIGTFKAANYLFLSRFLSDDSQFVRALYKIDQYVQLQKNFNPEVRELLASLLELYQDKNLERKEATENAISRFDLRVAIKKAEDAIPTTVQTILNLSLHNNGASSFELMMQELDIIAKNYVPLLGQKILPHLNVLFKAFENRSDAEFVTGLQAIEAILPHDQQSLESFTEELIKLYSRSANTLRASSLIQNFLPFLLPSKEMKVSLEKKVRPPEPKSLLYDLSNGDDANLISGIGSIVNFLSDQPKALRTFQQSVLNLYINSEGKRRAVLADLLDISHPEWRENHLAYVSWSAIIRLPNGRKPVRDLKIGDTVLTYNRRANALSEGVVTAIEKRESRLVNLYHDKLSLEVARNDVNLDFGMRSFRDLKGYQMGSYEKTRGVHDVYRVQVEPHSNYFANDLLIDEDVQGQL